MITVAVVLGASLTFAPAGKIAVLPCHVDENVQGTVPDLVGEYVLTAVSDRGEYEVIGMDDIEAIIGFDRQKDLLGCDDVSCFADIGGALGVDRLLQVKIAMAGESWAMTAKLINAGEARVESRVTRMIEGDASALLKDIPNLIGKLFGDAPPPAAAAASTKPTVETTAKPEEPAGPLAPSRYEVGAVQVTGITSVKIDEQTLSIKDGDEALTDSYWTTGLFTRWREASVGRLHFLLEGQAALSTVESFKGDGSGYSGGTSFLTYLHVMQLVRFTIYENLERWLLASTDRVAIDVGVGGFVRVFGAGDAGLIARVAAQLAWFHLGPTWTYSTELGSQISIDAGLRFGIF